MTMPEVSCKAVDMQNNSMALFHVSHPPAQTDGGEDIVYIYLYFLDPITNPYLGPPPWLHPVTKRKVVFLFKKIFGNRMMAVR